MPELFGIPFLLPAIIVVVLLLFMLVALRVRKRGKDRRADKKPGRRGGAVTAAGSLDDRTSEADSAVTPLASRERTLPPGKSERTPPAPERQEAAAPVEHTAVRENTTVGAAEVAGSENEATLLRPATQEGKPATAAEPSGESEPATAAEPSGESEPATAAEPSSESEPAPKQWTPSVRAADVFADDPIQPVLAELLHGWGELSREDKNRLQVFRPERVRAAVRTFAMPKALKNDGDARARLNHIVRYADELGLEAAAPTSTPPERESPPIEISALASAVATTQAALAAAEAHTQEQTPAKTQAAAPLAAADPEAATMKIAAPQPPTERPQASPGVGHGPAEAGHGPAGVAGAPTEGQSAVLPETAPDRDDAPITTDFSEEEEIIRAFADLDSPEPLRAGPGTPSTSAKAGGAPGRADELKDVATDQTPASLPGVAAGATGRTEHVRSEPMEWVEVPAPSIEEITAFSEWPVDLETVEKDEGPSDWDAALAALNGPPPQREKDRDRLDDTLETPLRRDAHLGAIVKTAEQLMDLPAAERREMVAFLQPSELAGVLARTEDQGLKKAVIDTLENVATPASLDVLRRCLEDDDPEIQMYALHAADRILGSD